MHRNQLFCLALFFLLLALYPVSAQVETDFGGHPLQVFLQQDIDRSGLDRLLFVDSLTGEDTPLEVNGTRYTLLGRAVLFFDTVANRAMLVTPDGEISRHPFIQPNERTRRIDWIVSEGGGLIAWTLTDASETPNNLTTTTSVANLDGTNPRKILVDGPRDGIRALPLAFNTNNTVLYMDYQPDALAGVTPFPQFAGIFAVDLETSYVSMLPGEPGCFCGAGLGAGVLVRLKLAADLNGFDVVVNNLVAQVSKTVPALRLVNFTQAGDVLISPDGSRAVYTLAQVRDFGGPNEYVQSVFVLVDLGDATQAPLTTPLTTFLRPVEWTEDNSAIIFTSPTVAGTWKINLGDGRLTKIAGATYLGTLN